MPRLYCLTLGFFLLAVSAAKEDFQGYITEKTKGTTVTNDRLLKKENNIGHGTETIPTENTNHHTAMTATAKFPGAILFNTRLKQPYKGMQIIKTPAVIASPSTEHLVSKQETPSLTSTRDNPSAMKFDSESEIPLISNYEEIVFPSTQAALESMINGTSEPEVHLSADALKVPPWLGTLLDNRNQRNTNSVPLTSADGGLGVPIVSASRPPVIDNTVVPADDSDDKRYQGKGISALGRNVYLSSTIQSIFQSDTAKDSVRGNVMTNLCVTCLTDRREASTEESVTLHGLSPHSSSDYLGAEGLTLHFNSLTTPLPDLEQVSAGEPEEAFNKNISLQNIPEHSNFGDKRMQVHNETFLPLSFKKTVNHSQSILNKSQITYFPSDAGIVAFDTQSLAEMSPITQRDNEKQSRHTHASETFFRETPNPPTALHYSSKSNDAVTGRTGEEEFLGKKVNIGDSQSKRICFRKNNKTTSHTIYPNFKNIFIENSPLAITVPSSNVPVSAGNTARSQKSAPPVGSNHNSTSDPAAGTSSIEPHSAITSFSLSRPTTLPVKSTEFPSVSGRSNPLITALKSQTQTKLSSQTGDPILTLLPRNYSFGFSSGSIKSHFMEKQASQSFNTIHSIIEQSSVDPPGQMIKAVTRDSQTPVFTARNIVPLQLFLSESGQDASDGFSTLTSSTQSSKLFPERLTRNRFYRTSAKGSQESTGDVMRYKHEALTQTLAKRSDLLVGSSTVHNLKNAERTDVFTVVAENGDMEILKLEDKQGKKLQETTEVLKLQEEKGSEEDETSENKRRDILRLDTTASGKQAKIINTGAEIRQNTEREAGEIEEHRTKINGKDSERTTGEEYVTLNQEKNSRQGHVAYEEDAERKDVTKIKRETSTKNVAEKQRESLTEEEADPAGKETSSKEDIKREKEIGKEDMTNVPLGPMTNPKELNRDKGQLTKLSFCHRLIKQLRATEYKGIHLAENTTQTEAFTTKSFSLNMESNNRSLPEPETKITSILGPYRTGPSQSTPNKVVESTFSHAAVPKLSHLFEVSTSTSREKIHPIFTQHANATESVLHVLSSISSMVSVKTPEVAIAASFMRAKPHFTVNSSTPNLSIIHNILDHKHKSSPSHSKANSVLHITNVTEQGEFNIPSVNPSPHQQLYNESSTRTSSTTVLSSDAHVSIEKFHPDSKINLASTSYDDTSGQFSFTPSDPAAHPDAWLVPVDANEQRSAQTLMALMSPGAKNDQFPLSTMSPLFNLRVLGDDSLPGTYSPTVLTGSVKEEKLPRQSSNTEYSDSRSDHNEFLLRTADESNPAEKTDSVRMMVTSEARRTNVVTKQMAKKKDEKNSFPLISLSSKHPVIATEELNSLHIAQSEELAAKNSNENNGSDLSSTGSNNEADNTVTMTTNSNSLNMVINGEFVNVPDYFTIPVLNINNLIGTTGFAESDILPIQSKIQANAVTNSTISDMKHQSTQTTKKTNSLMPQDNMSDNSGSVPQSNFRRNTMVLAESHQQIAVQITNVSTDSLATTTKTNDYVSLATTQSIGGLTVSRTGHESLLTMTESVATENPSEATHADHMVLPNSHIELLSVRELPITPTIGKLTPAVKREKRTETESVKQPEHEISVQAIEHSQHAPPAMLSPINDPEPDIQGGLLTSAHRVGGAHNTTPNMTEITKYHSFQDNEIALTTKDSFEVNHSLQSKNSTEHMENVFPEKSSILEEVTGNTTDDIPPTNIMPTDVINRTCCKTRGSVNSGMITEITPAAGENYHTEIMYKRLTGTRRRNHVSARSSSDRKSKNDSCRSDCPAPEKTTLQVTDPEFAVLSTVTAKSYPDQAAMSKKASSVTDKTVHLERHWTPEHARFVKRTTQRRFLRETSAAQEATATEVTLSEPEESPGQLTIKTPEQTLHTEKNSKTQLNRRASKAEIFEEQNATRSVRAMAKGEMAIRESGRRLVLPDSESNRRQTLPHLYLSGLTEVSDDLCGSGNYTAEMSVNLGRSVAPGDAVPALGNLRVVINLKTNNSQINLGVTSCCLSPTIQLDLNNSTCCLFSRLAAEPAGITLLPSAVSSSASFTISLFQMINYSVVYLHCDLNVCPRNHSDCERQCRQQRSAFPSEGLETIVTNLRNRISFGPMLKQGGNSTFPEEIDPSELDLALVVVSLVVGSSLITVLMLLVWLAYRRRAIWLVHTSSSPPPCCGCLRPGGDLIQP